MPVLSLVVLGLIVLAGWPAWAQSTEPAFDDADAQLRIRQAAGAVSVAAGRVDALRQQLDGERARVVQTNSEREVNQATIATLERDLQAAEAQRVEREAILKAAHEARAVGLSREAERRKAEERSQPPAPPESPAARLPAGNAPPPTPTSRPSVASSFPAMSDRDNCKTALAADLRRWDDRPDFQTYMREARQRGYDEDRCRALVTGVAPPPANPPAPTPPAAPPRPTANAPAQFPTMTDRDVCKTALTADLSRWDDRWGYAGYTQEARHRGYDEQRCRALVSGATPPPATAPRPPASSGSTANAPAQFPTMTDRDVCRTALTADLSGWDNRLGYAGYAQEARRRGYDEQRCRTLARGAAPPPAGRISVPSTPSQFPTMTDLDICRTALESDFRRWENRPNFTRYVQEAERRGLTPARCGELAGSRR